MGRGGRSARQQADSDQQANEQQRTPKESAHAAGMCLHTNNPFVSLCAQPWALPYSALVFRRDAASSSCQRRVGLPPLSALASSIGNPGRKHTRRIPCFFVQLVRE